VACFSGKKYKDEKLKIKVMLTDIWDFRKKMFFENYRIRKTFVE